MTTDWVVWHRESWGQSKGQPGCRLLSMANIVIWATEASSSSLDQIHLHQRLEWLE